MEEFNKIINNICKELNIKLTVLSDNWLKVLEYKNKIRYIDGYKFSLNDHGIGNILDDKGLFYDLMRYLKYPITDHEVIFKNTSSEIINNYFNLHNKKIIVKGNIGTCGREVFLINNERELFLKLDYLFKSQYSISLCPYYELRHEYRVIVLNNKAKFIYGKNKPVVIGNGVSNLLELAKNFNYNYYSICDSYPFDINYIPKLNEKFILNFQFNLSRGATFFEVNDILLKNKIINLAEKVSCSCNIQFGSVDIVETMNGNLMIMEANSGVMMDNVMKKNNKYYRIGHEIYRDAIRLMFEE